MQHRFGYRFRPHCVAGTREDAGRLLKPRREWHEEWRGFYHVQHKRNAALAKARCAGICRYFFVPFLAYGPRVDWAFVCCRSAEKLTFLDRRCGGGTTARAGWSSSHPVVGFLTLGSVALLLLTWIPDLVATDLSFAFALTGGISQEETPAKNSRTATDP